MTSSFSIRREGLVCISVFGFLYTPLEILESWLANMQLTGGDTRTDKSVNIRAGGTARYNTKV